MPSRQNSSTRRVEPRLKMSCHTLVSCASRPETNDIETLARSSTPSCPEMFAVLAATAVDVAEAEAQDVDVVDRMLNEAAAAGLGHVGAPLRGVGALNREVLVVAEHGGHRRAQAHPTRPDRGTPGKPAHCAAPARTDSVPLPRPPPPRAPSRAGRSTARGFSQKTARPAATASSTAWRWAAVGVHTQTASHRAATSAASATTSAPMASARDRARRSRWSWIASTEASITPASIMALSPSVCAHAMRPDSDEPDTHHGGEVTRAARRRPAAEGGRPGATPP